MLTWAYPAVIREEGPDDWLVVFPDIPEAITGGDNLEAARAAAADVLEEAILGALAHRLPIPAPRPARDGEELVILDPVTAARAALAQAMAEQSVTGTELGRRLGLTEGAVRRLLKGDRRGGIKIDTVLQALRELGAHAALSVS